MKALILTAGLLSSAPLYAAFDSIVRDTAITYALACERGADCR